MRNTVRIVVGAAVGAAFLAVGGCASLGEPTSRVERERALGCAAAGDSAGGARDLDACEDEPD
jgi:hypothetical protein